MDTLPEETLQTLSQDQPFCFECHRERACFNHCCHDMCQFLYPYDILRLKKRLKMNSADFLTAYCILYDGESSGLPVVSFKLDPNREQACPFLTESGCHVYDDRPASCRIFPLARGLVRNRATGRIQAHYARIPDPSCQGFASEKTQTLKDWLTDQDLHRYNHMNDAMMMLISLKNRLLPGPLQPHEKEIFITGCYDLDGFDRKIYASGQLTGLFPEERLLSAETHDEERLLLALDWVRHRIFGKAV